ncbi:hypothetical protein D3C81_1823850 [compost metagenome]
MKLNIIFLVIGLVLTVVSKMMQFVFKSKIGDIIVIPAAIFFVLAILFSISKYSELPKQENGIYQMVIIAFFACLAVVSFQVMMILLVGHHNKIGWALILPFVLSVLIVIKKWMSAFS